MYNYVGNTFILFMFTGNTIGQLGGKYEIDRNAASRYTTFSVENIQRSHRIYILRDRLDWSSKRVYGIENVP